MSIVSNYSAIRAARKGGAWVSWRSTSIDAESTLAAGSRMAHHASLRSSSLGRYTSIGRFSKVAFADLGAFCSVSWDVTIGAISHPLDHLTTHAFPYVPELGISPLPRDQVVERTTIGHDVWIGTQAIIMPGVTIGTGAVIGAASVVTRDVEPYSVVFGAPAKHQRFRLAPDVIGAVQASEWWNLPEGALCQAIDAFRTPDIAAALRRIDTAAGR